MINTSTYAHFLGCRPLVAETVPNSVWHHPRLLQTHIDRDRDIDIDFQNVDPPEGSILYTIGVLEPRIGELKSPGMSGISGWGKHLCWLASGVVSY